MRLKRSKNEGLMNSKTDAIIEAKNLYKTYNRGQETEVHALNDVSFSVKKGEIVAIMGESGSGKTTLLNCISGIDKVTKGNIFIDGSDLTKMNDSKKTTYRAAKMGFIFQSFNLIPVLSVLENVELPAVIVGRAADLIRERSKELLKIVGLDHRLNHKPSEISGGQKQRVAIARALINDPAVIWADEPTGNLDSKTAKDVMELLVSLNKELGATIVMVTHSDEIASYAHRIVRMDSGKIVK